MHPRIPMWVLLYGSLLALLILFSSGLRYANLNCDFGWFLQPCPGVGTFLRSDLGPFLARNVAIGVVMVIALFLRSPQMLMATLLIALLTGGIEFVHRVVVGDSRLPAIFWYGVLLWLPGSLAVYRLRSLAT